MDRYYVTEGGDYYHAKRDCVGFDKGHRAARANGYTEHPIESVPLAEAKKRALRGEPCKHCVGRS